jgi:hypothetical protein
MVRPGGIASLEDHYPANRGWEASWIAEDRQPDSVTVITLPKFSTPTHVRTYQRSNGYEKAKTRPAWRNDSSRNRSYSG